MLSLRRPFREDGSRKVTELEKARADLLAAQQRADETQAKLDKARRSAKVRLRVTAMVMMVAALVRLAWDAMGGAVPAEATNIEKSITQRAAAMLVKSGSAPNESEVALQRLHEAFLTFQEDQQDIVREVNSRYAGTEFTCTLAWNDGMPELRVKDKAANRPMLASAVNQCAAGVERLRRERDAELEQLVK